MDRQTDFNSLPIQLEVQIDGQMKQGSHGILDYRVINQADEQLEDVEIDIKSSLELHQSEPRRINLPQGDSVPLFSSFVASLEGQHYFSFQFRLGHNSVYEGRFSFEVVSPTATTQIINFTDARKIEGRTVVGTEGAQISFNTGNPNVNFTDDRTIKAQTVVGTEGAKLAFDNDGPEGADGSNSIQSSSFVIVFLRPRDSGPAGPAKRPCPGFEGLEYKDERLLLQVHRGEESINIGLVAKTSVALGRRRGNDIVTRVYPPSVENDCLTGVISSNHARIAFTANGAELHDQSTYGTTMAGHVLSGDSALLPQGTEIRLADALSLGCKLFYGNDSDSLSALRRFVKRYLGGTLLDPVGPLRAVRLNRLDNLPGVEEYVVFQHIVTVGSGPDCEIQIRDSSVSPIHAQILWLGNSMWLESLQTRRDTLADGQQIPRNQLVPLHPNLPLQFGDVEVTVSNFRQQYLDM